eukprot:GEZU01014446.1.p1 GENE.GEZU01014446.1~~GEZU01014446.1.p1  ORF type:complete len:960 (-),score=385.73 GEZU01014446.1:109-2988(-)
MVQSWRPESKVTASYQCAQDFTLEGNGDYADEDEYYDDYDDGNNNNYNDDEYYEGEEGENDGYYDEGYDGEYYDDEYGDDEYYEGAEEYMVDSTKKEDADSGFSIMDFQKGTKAEAAKPAKPKASKPKKAATEKKIVFKEAPIQFQDVKETTTSFLANVRYEHSVKECLKMCFDLKYPKKTIIQTINPKWVAKEKKRRQLEWGNQLANPAVAQKFEKEFGNPPKCIFTEIDHTKKPDFSNYHNSKRAYYASCVNNGKIWIFGGNDGKSNFNDLQRFDPATGEWRVFKEIDREFRRPPPCSHHQMVPDKDNILIFAGGKSGMDIFALTNVNQEDKIAWALRIPNRQTWYSYEEYNWAHPTLSGDYISSRQDFTVNVIDRPDQFWLFGGRKGVRAGTNELFMITQDSAIYMQYRVTQVKMAKNKSIDEDTLVWPSPRYGHATAVANNLLYVFGGRDQNRDLNDLYVFNPTTRLWEEIVIDGSSVPPPLSFASMVAVNNKHLIISGGLHDGVAQNAMYRFDIGRRTWSSIKVKGHGESAGSTPIALQQPIYGHQSMMVAAKVYHIGGLGASSAIKNTIIQIDQLSDEGVDPMLSDYLAKKREAGFLCDVILKARDAEGEIRDIHAHKCILGARCEYFASLFAEQQQLEQEQQQQQQKEQPIEDVGGAEDGEFDIDAIQRQLDARLALVDGEETPAQEIFISDCNAEVLEAFVHFLYTGKLILSSSNNEEDDNGGTQSNTKQLVEIAKKWSNTHHADVIETICSSSKSVFLNIAAEIQNKMESDLERLVDNPLYSDLTLKTSTRVTYAHKLMLCRSPYFTSMLTSGMKESAQSQIEFGDQELNAEAVLEVLKFLYTDRNEVTPQNCVGVLVSSLMFGLRELSNYCRCVVQQHLTAQNVLDVLEISSFYNDAVLLRESIKYCKRHYDEMKFVDKYRDLDSKIKAQIEEQHNKANKANKNNNKKK